MICKPRPRRRRQLQPENYLRTGRNRSKARRRAVGFHIAMRDPRDLISQIIEGFIALDSMYDRARTNHIRIPTDGCARHFKHGICSDERERRGGGALRRC